MKALAATVLTICVLVAAGVPAQGRAHSTPPEHEGFGFAPENTGIEPPASTRLHGPGLPYRYTHALANIKLAANAADQGPAGTGSASPTPRESRVTPEQLRRRNAAIIGSAVGLVAAYGASNWWQDGFGGAFRTVSEGWFGQTTQSGGADKFGHAFFSYSGARLLSAAFGAVGNNANAAAALGALWSLGIMTGVEAVDGYSKQYRFSTVDAIMNVAGAAAGYIMERNPTLDALVDLRIHYLPSESGKFNVGGDYSGQTYLVALKASGVPSLRSNGVLRYFELSFGYGTRGYDSPPQVERRRNLYFGISLNLSELLGQTAFRGNKDRTRTQRATDLFFEFIQPPGTAVPLAKHRL